MISAADLASRWPPGCGRVNTHTVAAVTARLVLAAVPFNPLNFWNMAKANEHDGTLTIMRVKDPDADGWPCQRALTTRNNVAIDVTAWAGHASDQGDKIATALAAKVAVKSMNSPYRRGYRGIVVLALACVITTSACSHVLTGQPRALSARDSSAPTVAPADLDKLLLSDRQISDIIGAGPLATFHTYSTITPADAGETFSDPSCAEAVYNTMWTAYDRSGYTGALGHGLREPGDRHPHAVDQGVVAFPTADAATRFVARVTTAWQHCADAHFSDTGPSGPSPNTRTDWYTVGYPIISDISTLVVYPEGRREQTDVRAITSRSNVVIDVGATGPAMPADKLVAIVNAIAAKLPH